VIPYGGVCFCFFLLLANLLRAAFSKVGGAQRNANSFPVGGAPGATLFLANVFTADYPYKNFTGPSLPLFFFFFDSIKVILMFSFY